LLNENVACTREHKASGLDIYLYVIVAVSFLVHLYFSFVGWNNNLLDFFSFRQTQTAITSFYVIQEGFQINYQTPILGAPWSIPMEFPLYQWIVAIVVAVTHMPLDQAGRLVSLIFFYLTLIPVYGMLNYTMKNRAHKLMVISLILLNPVYIFWSRTFMIESAALFFSLAFLYCTIRTIMTKSVPFFVLAIVLGVLGGLTKVTTFAVVLIGGFGFYAWYWNRNRKCCSFPRYLLHGAFLFGIPFLVNVAWVKYTDHLKHLNPLADFITSGALTSWNFGTWEQKLSLVTWYHILYVYLPLFVLVMLLWRGSRRLEAMASLALFWIGPAIFTNLYFVHEYYSYASSIFFSLFIGFILVSLIETKNKKTAILVYPVVLAISCSFYFNTYYDKQKTGHQNDPVIKLTEQVRVHTQPNDIMLVYGQDWNPVIPYYSQRKAIMVRGNPSLSDKNIQQSLNNLGNQKVRALIVGGGENEEFVQERVHYFGLKSQPVFKNENYRLYVAGLD
jgi:hypothetical protein